MKSETINSFSEGLALDVNELNTSNKIMTDALNATLLTYNGNEFSLQNDMGNVAVGSAYLPKGYVPVGMKEHGGIIYVASHNPETKKGQIGCFPSPQQLYGNEESDFTSFSINLENLLSEESYEEENEEEEEEKIKKILYINHEFYREDLFVPKNSKARELHPGDEFIVACDLTNYLDLLEKGVLKFKLASVGKDGVINYIDDKDLKLYNGFYTVNGVAYYPEIENLQEYITIGDTKYYVIKEVGSQPYIEYNDTKYYKSSVKTWIYNSKSAPAFNSSLVQVFPGNTSGKLMIIVEYNVFDDFNLTWKYNINTEENKVTNAVFEGTATQSYDKQECKKIFNIDTKGSGDTITIGAADNKISYKIAPYSKYGIHKKLIKEGTIDVEELMKNSNGVIDSWNYYVGNNKIEIYWGFNYLNINGEEIDKMRFVFIPIEDIVNINVSINNNAIIYKNIEYEIKYIKIGDKYYEAINGHIEIDNTEYDIIGDDKKYINYNGVSYFIEYVNINNQYYKVIYTDDNNVQIAPDVKVNLFNDGNEWYTVEIEKPSYIGSFEDTFVFNDKLKKGCIYVCRIDKHENNTWTNVGFEYVYTSTFFNNKTAQEIKNYKDNRPEITVNIDVSYNIDGETHNQNHIKTESFIQNNMGEFINNNLLLPLYVQNPSETNTYGFLSGIHRTGQFNLKEAIDVSKTGFDGNYNYNLKSSIIGEIDTKESIKSKWELYNTSYKRKKYLNNSDLNYLGGPLDQIGRSSNTINYSLYRLIYAPAGPIDIKELSIERLRPAYEDENDFDNLFAFKYNQNNQLLCVGAEDEDMRYNTVIRGTKSTTEEDKGTTLFKSNSNISPDDTHYSSALNSMRSGKPGTIGILAGISSQNNGADAQLCFSAPNGYIRTNEINGWEVVEKGTTGLKIYPVDEGQNYLIASWKGSEGRDYLINVMSRKTDVKKVDYYMKVLLSQLLIVKNKKEYIRYTAPNPNQYNYSLPEDSVFEFKLTVTTFNPILKYADNDLESLYESWSKSVGVKNYLPKLKYTINNNNYYHQYTDTFEVKIGGNIEIDSNLLNLYVNSYNLGNSAIQNPNPTDNTTIINDSAWRQKIYRGTVEGISNDGICKLTINENTGNYTVKSELIDTISQLKTNSQEIDDVTIFPTTNILTTQAKLNLVTEKIPEGWYNEILLDESYIKDLHSNNNAAICEGVWIYGGITNAPDLLNYIYLGDNTTRFDNTKQIQ